jgi:hypothetical protein
MAASILLTALFFAVVTIWKFGDLEQRLAERPFERAADIWGDVADPRDFDEQMRLANAKAAYSLEREIIARKYNQNNLAFASRLWTRFMGFVTGMILALVGAAFVLGKLDMERSEVSATASGVSLTLRSASPGVLLAVFGTILMATSIAVPATITTRETAVYFPVSEHGKAGAVAPADAKAPVSSANPAEVNEPKPKTAREREK